MAEDLDMGKLYFALSLKKGRKSWRELGRLLDIDQGVFSRLKDGKCPDGQTVYKMLRWLELDSIKVLDRQ